MTLAEMMARRDQWMAEKPTFDPGAGIQPKDGDLILGYFAASGNDGQRLFSIYRSHIFPQMSSNGKRFNAHRWCPQQSGEGTECQYCALGHTDVKERMSMWFYVCNFLHAQMPQPRQGEAPKNWPAVPYEGRSFFNETINGWRRWDTSAWKESPAATIGKLGSLYGSLHAFMFQMATSGTGMQTRFSVFAIPNSAPLPPELYQEALNTLEPIPDTLRKELSVPVQMNPVQQQQPPQGLPAQPGTWIQQPAPQAFIPTSAPVSLQPFANPAMPTAPAFVPGAPSAAAFPPPGAAGVIAAPPAAAPVAFAPAAPVVAAPAIEAAPQAPAATQEVPVAAPVAAAPVSVPVQPAPIPVVPQPAAVVPPTPTQPVAQPAAEMPASQPEGDPRRPMQRMF